MINLTYFPSAGNGFIVDNPPQVSNGKSSSPATIRVALRTSGTMTI